MIAGAGDPLTAAEDDRLARLSQVLAVPIEKPHASAGTPADPSAPGRPLNQTPCCTDAEHEFPPMA